MLEGVADLTLAQLNEATLAWIELEYNRTLHCAIGQTPLHRYLNDKDVSRPCPDTEKLQLAFTAEGPTHSAPQRRHSQPGRYSFRNSFPLCSSGKALRALRLLGLELGLS